MTVAPIEDLTAVLGTVGDLVGGVGQDQGSAPTPCPESDVRELVNHLILGHRLFTGILRGEAAVAPGALDPTADDAHGDDAHGDDPWLPTGGAAEDLLTAFGRPGVLEQVFQVPAGAVPGIAAVPPSCRGGTRPRLGPRQGNRSATPVPRPHSRAPTGVHPRQAR